MDQADFEMAEVNHPDYDVPYAEDYDYLPNNQFIARSTVGPNIENPKKRNPIRNVSLLSAIMKRL